MRLYGVRIFVARLEEARRFYLHTLGLSLAWDIPEMGAFGAKLENAELIVEQVDMEGEDAGRVGRFVGASIAVDDIEALYQDLLRQGVTFDGPPEKQPWGGTLAHFSDPDGNVLTLLG